MTTYTFKPSASNDEANWGDPAVWVGGVAPDSPDADVNFATVIQTSTGQPYVSFVNVEAGDSFAVRSVALRDYLIVAGSLSVSQTLTQYVAGEIDMYGGTLSAGAIVNTAYDIQGDGHVVAGALTNETLIIGGGLVLDLGSLVNDGTLAASQGVTTVNVTAGGYFGLVNGVLGHGALEALPGGTLALNLGQVITTDASAITLSGGVITSRDPASGQDVALTTSLSTITASGELTVDQGASYHFGRLSVAGLLTLTNAGQISADQLVIAAGGELQGAATVASSLENDGVVLAGVINNDAGYGTLVLTGAVTGDGTLEIAAGHVSTGAKFDSTYGPTLELGGATAQDIVFDGYGTLQLDQPAAFTGAIRTFGSGDTIVLEGVGLSSVTGVTYTGDGAGGTLTLQEAGGALSLHFLGGHTLSDFTLTAGPQALSSDPPSLKLTVSGAGQLGAEYSATGDNQTLTAPVTGDAYFQASGANDAVQLNGNVGDYTLSRVQPTVVSGATSDQVGAFLLTATNGSGAYAIEEGVATVRFQDGQYLSLKDLPAYVHGSDSLELGGGGNDLLYQTPSEHYELFVGGSGQDDLYLSGNVNDYTLESFTAQSAQDSAGLGGQIYSGMELVANNGSGDLLIDSSVETIHFQNGQYLAYSDLQKHVAATPDASSTPLLIALDGDSGRLTYGYYGQVSPTETVLLNGNVGDYSLSRDASGDFVLSSQAGAGGAATVLTLGQASVVQFGDGQYLSAKDLGAYVAGSDVFTQGTSSDDLLFTPVSGDSYVVGGAGADNLYLTGNTRDYTLQPVDIAAGAGHPAINGYELIANNGSGDIYIDQSTETIHFQNGQYLAFQDLTAYIPAHHG